MAINFVGSPGAFFNAMGKLGLAIKQVKSYQTAQKTNYIDANVGIYGQLNGAIDIQALISQAYLVDFTGPENACATVQNIAQLYANRLVWLDNPQPGQDLTSINLFASITEIIRQMKEQGVTIQQLTVSASAGPSWGNVQTTPGNPVIVTSLYRPSDGLLLENAFGELLQVTCTADSFTGGQTAFNEPFLFTGEAGIGDVFAWNWPQGSDTSLSINAIDGATSNGSDNMLDNSDFESWSNTANIPDQWTLTTGTAGVNTNQETGIVYSGTSSLRLTGDNNNTTTTLTQTFDSSNGTTDILNPEIQYSCNLFLRRGGTAVAQGVLQVDLIDSNSNIISDNAGTACSFTIDLTSLSTNWQAFNGVFRTPYNLPATVSLRLHLTTALPNGVSVYIDKASLGQMSQLYTSGPYVALHAGNIPSTVNDFNTLTITNSLGAGGTLSTFQVLMNQLFSLQPQDILIPSSLTPTVSDSLIG